MVQRADDGRIVKRVRQFEDKRWWLVSDNPAYNPVRLQPGHRIVGYVANWRAGPIWERRLDKNA